MPVLHLATFQSDVTPPLGHPLCGGWIEPARGVDDPLRALGVVLLGAGAPIVLCAVDWCGVRNDANLRWRQALAKAAHTTPERVAVQCVHPHNAPFADVEAQHLLESVPGSPPSLNLKFFDRAVQQSADALRESLKKTSPFTHLGIGQARVEQVASNRRILGDNGKIRFSRTSATKDPKVRAEPEGLIDPWLKTLSFWKEEQPLAALNYYATHPMSYYGDGRVSADFCGLARQKRQEEEPKIFQLYFNGCAGNVTAGKYNDGSKANRPVLRDRIYTAMKAAWKATRRHALTTYEWRVEPIRLLPRREKSFGAEESRKVLEDAKAIKARRGNAAFQLAWLARQDRPIDLTCLDLGKALVLHLPGEPFIEYQLKAQQMRKDVFVCVAGYGDGGPGYIPTDHAYLEGGYEPSVALARPSEALLTKKIAKVIKTREE
ncbi:MAG TPA: hypothetical protein VN688_24340 [Gemmataceae bacterium]|nr:hypothetical protein [Gemmataceae bacterium]